MTGSVLVVQRRIELLSFKKGRPWPQFSGASN